MLVVTRAVTSRGTAGPGSVAMVVSRWMAALHAGAGLARGLLEMFAAVIDGVVHRSSPSHGFRAASRGT